MGGTPHHLSSLKSDVSRQSRNVSFAPGIGERHVSLRVPVKLRSACYSLGLAMVLISPVDARCSTSQTKFRSFCMVR